MKTLNPIKRLAILTILNLLLLSSFQLFAQDFQFANSFGGTKIDEVTDIEVDANGNIYTIGTFEGTMDVDPGAGVTELTTTNGPAIYIIKSDSEGALIWAKQFGSGKAPFGVSIRYLYARMELDASGNIYIGGTFNYSGDFDPGAGTKTLVPSGNEGISDIFISKLNAGGDLVWVRKIGASKYDNAKDIALDASGNIFITGSYLGTVDFDPSGATNSLISYEGDEEAYLAKYNSSGGFLWAGRVVGSSNNPMDEGDKVIITSGGEPIVAGKGDGGGGLVFHLNSTNYGVKRIWGYLGSIAGLAVDDSDNIYVTGSFSGAIEPGLDSNGNTDIFVEKILPNGGRDWLKTIGGSGYDYARAISVGQSGESYIVGEMQDTVDFDPGPDEFNLTGTSFITSLDVDGNFFRSAKAFEASGASLFIRQVPVFSAISNLEDNLYLGGNTDVAFDIDPSDAEEIITPNGSTDGFFAVFTPEPVTFTIDENLPFNANVGAIPANSAIDGSSTIVAGNTDNAFGIDFTNGRFFVNNPDALDYETNPSFRISVFPPEDSETYIINLNDVPESPVIEDQEFTIIATIADEDELGTVIATDPQEDAITYSITSGNTENIFALDNSTGILTIEDRSLLDFSEPDTLHLEVEVSDGTETASATVSIIINIAPVFEWTATAFAFNEGGLWFLSVPVTDPESDDYQVSIVSGNEDGLLSIANTANANNGTSANPTYEIFPFDEENGIDFESEPNSFELVMKVTDAAGNETTSDPISITINNLNDNTPTLADQEVSINEGLPNGSVVTTLEGEDLDGDELSYSIVSGNTDNAFIVDSNTGEITVANVDVLVFANNPVFTIVVNVSDDMFDADATVTINLLESTIPTIEDQSFTIISTIDDGDAVGQIEAFDAQGDALTYTITAGNDDEVFSLEASTGVLTIIDRSALDFSAPDTLSLTVSVSDGREESNAIISVALNVAPVFNWTTTSFSFDENLQWSILNPISDPEEDELTLTIESGNTDNLLTLENTANASTGVPVPDAWEIYPLTAAGIDFETHPSFELVIKAEDALGNITLSDPITININNVNDNAPTATDETVSISEGTPNGSFVTTVVGADIDNDPLTYTITSGNTDNAFALNASSGELTINNVDALVFTTNPTFSLVVNVSDGVSSANATITINLSEASGPVIVDQTFNVISSIETGDEVGTVIAVDAQGDPITYTILSGNTNNAFSLDATTGLLSVSDRSQLDFSSSFTYVLNIAVNDDRDTNTANVSIILNTAPVFNWTSTSFNFDENAQWFLTIPVTDGEEDVLSFTITSGNESSLLSIINTASAGADPVYEITPSAQSIDFEVDQTSFELFIDVTDDAGNTTTSESISISINNVNDNAPETENKTVAINQNLPNGQAVTTVTGSDADGDALTYAIEGGNTDDAFTIDESTGDITVSNSSALVFETNPTFALSVGVSDGVFTTTASITVNLNEQAVNTAPIISNQNFTLLENSENGTSVATIEATDLEGDALTFAIISGNTSNAFLLSSSTGAIIVTNSEVLDFEINPSFSLFVSVSDGALTETATITVELEDVDEESVLAVSDQEKELKIYPNPTIDYFQISNNLEVQKVQVLDISAKVIMQFDFNASNQYSLRGLNAGVYIIQVKTESSITQGRIVIK